MFSRDMSNIFTYIDIERINQEEFPIQRAVEHALNVTSKTLPKKTHPISHESRTLFDVSPDEWDFERGLNESSIVSMVAERFTESTSLKESQWVNEFIQVYKAFYPFLISSHYAPYELVHMALSLFKDITYDEPKFIGNVHIRSLFELIILIIAMEYGYSKDYPILEPFRNIFDMSLNHREYWLSNLTEHLYPIIKDKIKFTPNLKYVFEFDRYAAHVQELNEVFDSISLDEHAQETELPSGLKIRPFDYMLKKTNKIANPDFFFYELLTRFAYVNRRSFERGDYYLIAPPLVEYLKKERSSNHWQGSHQHIFYDKEDEAIRFKIIHIGMKYYAQRLIGTPMWDYSSRIYPLTPKRTLHIKDLNYPTIDELTKLHQTNLDIGMYKGL